MEEGMNMLDDGLIMMFSDSILSRGIMYGEFLLCPFLFKIQNKTFVQVLSPTVGVKNLD